MIVKNCCLTLLALAFLLAAGSVPAQASEQACVIVLEGQNQNRTVAGAVNVECGFPYETYAAPFGNWGVPSNYSPLLEDGNQFRGWKPMDDPLTKQYWNSCTSLHPPPDCDYYNANSCVTQSSPTTVTHGRMYYRTRVESCPPDLPGSFPVPGSYNGCQDGERTVTQASNHMTLDELDDWFGSISGDGHDRVGTLRFPGTSVTLTDCEYDGCPEETTAWVPREDDLSSSAHVEAQLRMKAHAYLQGFCDWSW